LDERATCPTTPNVCRNPRSRELRFAVLERAYHKAAWHVVAECEKPYLRLAERVGASALRPGAIRQRDLLFERTAECVGSIGQRGESHAACGLPVVGPHPTH
jgi:hypothetical protein